jgi:Ca2+-binding RTX toxin-like protein
MLVTLVAAVIATMNGSFLTASNTLYQTHLGVARWNGLASAPITANALKPAQCASLTLSNLITGSGDITGTGAPDLILGGPSAQTIRGSGGGDCIIGGGGVDHLQGQGGSDICIGNSSTIFNNCSQVFVQ